MLLFVGWFSLAFSAQSVIRFARASHPLHGDHSYPLEVRFRVAFALFGRSATAQAPGGIVVVTVALAEDDPDAVA